MRFIVFGNRFGHVVPDVCSLVGHLYPMIFVYLTLH